MITKEGISKPGRKKDQFWYKHRESAKTTLLDLQLFIEEAGGDNINRIITRETLKPVVEALLWRPLVNHDNPDPQSWDDDTGEGVTAFATDAADLEIGAEPGNVADNFYIDDVTINNASGI